MRVSVLIFLSFWMVSSLGASELLLEEAIDKALLASRQIKISRIDATLAKTNNLQNIALMSPKVSLGWANAYYDSPIQFDLNGHNAVIRPQETSAGFLQIIQPISMLVGLIQKVRADYKTQKAAETGSELSQVEIAFAAAGSYRQLQQLKSFNQIAEERVQLGLRQEQEGKAIFEAGKISKSDLLRVQMALGNFKVGAANIKTQYDSSLLAFKDLLGYELTNEVELSKIPLNPEIPTLEKEGSGGISPRLDIKIAQLTYEANKNNTWLSYASFLPNLSAFARVDKNFINPGAFSQAEFYSLGLNLSWDIWDGGSRFLNIRSASLMASKAHLNLLEVTRKASIDQEQKKLEFKTAWESLDLQKTSLEQAEQAYESASEKFKLGAISVTDLLQSELDLNNAKINWAKAITDLDIKHMLVQKANGQRRPESIL